MPAEHTIEWYEKRISDKESDVAYWKRRYLSSGTKHALNQWRNAEELLQYWKNQKELKNNKES